MGSDGAQHGGCCFQKIFVLKNTNQEQHGAPLLRTYRKISGAAETRCLLSFSPVVDSLSPATTPETPRREAKRERSEDPEFYLVFVWVLVVLV